MDLFNKTGYEKSGKSEVLFQWIICLCANAIGDAGIDSYAAYNRCNAEKLMKNMLVYTIRKNGKARERDAHVRVCDCACVRGAGGSQSTSWGILALPFQWEHRCWLSSD